MNQKQRAAKIKELTKVGDKLNSFQFGERTVTKKSEFNCYLNDVRHTWNTIEWCLRNSTLKFQDNQKQSELFLLYKGAKSEKVPMTNYPNI